MPKPAGRIYVYTVPGYDTEWSRTVGATTVEGRGRLKVGYTGRTDPRIRVKEQTGTVYPEGEGVEILFDTPAVREDGTAFKDHDVHKVLAKAGVQSKSEVFAATLDEVKAAIAAVRSGRPYDPQRTEDFGMRPEQQAAVDVTSAYFTEHAGDTRPPRFLWNAKMRFGKTFTTYQLAKRMEWQRVLVLTFKPAVLDSWRQDLLSHVDFSDWKFADRDSPVDPYDPAPIVWFASFQDFLGVTSEGDVKDHNVDLHLIDWDCVVVDEYHFGAWQGAAKEVCSEAPKTKPATEKELDKADQAAADQADEISDLAHEGTPRLLAATPDSGYKEDQDAEDLRITSRNYLYLSGTPFRALTEGEFNEDAIFNWTYPDEQGAKHAWDKDENLDSSRNPYRELPEMQMFTYALSEVSSTKIEQAADGIFDLSGYFEAKKDGSEYHFTDEHRVHEFLDMLRGKMTQTAVEKLLSGSRPPFPFSDNRFTDAVQHSVWLLPTVASAHAMKAALESHPYFRDFRVHVAAGGGAKMGAEAKKPVDAMLAEAAKTGQQTITLSCGKLMTGVTVPQWGSILILRSLRSAESYFQAAFRVQSPWVSRNDDGTRTINKATCFVFDFDPNRALSLIYQYGTKLAGSSTTVAPVDVIGELIEHLPIYAFDGGRMDPVDVNAVMDWGTAGAGAAMLARRWGSPRLIDLSEGVLEKLLGNEDLVERLQQVEDFRALREDATKLLANSKKARKKSGKKGGDKDPEDPELVAARKAKRQQVHTLRKKLLKFVQAVPVFMYLTDFREQALVDVIESLDTQLFERVTGLTIEDFRQLSEVGVFHPAHMNEAIWQFRLFERPSLSYLHETKSLDLDGRIGLWDHSVDASPMPS